MPFALRLIPYALGLTPYKPTNMPKEIYDKAQRRQRSELLAGREGMDRLDSARVIVFGVGGVGSWCCEALARSGVGHLTLVDSDCVAPSNINRQLPALCSTVGQPKVEVMRQRLLDINPDMTVETRCEMYTAETADSFDLDGYDYVIDAIDTLDCKLLLIRRATASTATLYSSMGAALKSDITKIEVARFDRVQGCPLARALRNKIRKSGVRLRRQFKCVYSPELLTNHPTHLVGEAAQSGPAAQAKTRANGTWMHAVAAFGLTLAQLVITDRLTDVS